MSKGFKKLAEELSERPIKYVVSTTSQLTMHPHTMEKSRGSFAAEREAIARDIVMQAINPHITQLIDLATDKRETAALIVDRLIPILPTSHLGLQHQRLTWTASQAMAACWAR